MVLDVASFALLCVYVPVKNVHAMSGVLVKGSGHSSPRGDSDGEPSLENNPNNGPKVHVFNEQTNYVPRRTIITVSLYLNRMQGALS